MKSGACYAAMSASCWRVRFSGGRKIRYREGGGWIERVFEVAGEDAEKTHSRLSNYLKQFDD